MAAHHAEMKHQALAAEAKRRYEALLAELTDERQAFAEGKAELNALRKECAALRRVAQAAMENERRAAAVVAPYPVDRTRRFASPPGGRRSPERADLASIDSGGDSPDEGRAPVMRTTYESRRDMRRRTYERLKAEKLKVAAAAG